MGGAQAARTMLDIQVAALKREGKPTEEAEIKRINEALRTRYERETDIRYAAARLWVDAVIAPITTREVLAHAFDIVTRHRDSRGFSVGVFQV
jgi:acetyl-CoA carboxylase carboxyltransferase component